MNYEAALTSITRVAKVAIALLGIVVGVFGASQAAASEWTLGSIGNPGSRDFMNGVACTTSSWCMAVGYYGTPGHPQARVWNGSSWSEAAPHTTESGSLAGVSCSSSTACTAVGALGNATLAERWNGTSWSTQTTTNPGKGNFFQGVSCPSSSYCVGVGTSAQFTLGEVWNGTSWSTAAPVNPTGATGAELGSVSCTSTTACIAVGGSITGGQWVPLAESWNGTSWTLQTAASPAKTVETHLASISCTSSSSCVAVGYYSPNLESTLTLIESWNGKTWTIQTSPNPSKKVSRLYGVSCVEASSCVAVGEYELNVTLAMYWNGTEWVTQTTENQKESENDYLTGVSCITTCQAVGSYLEKVTKDYKNLNETTASIKPLFKAEEGEVKGATFSLSDNGVTKVYVKASEVTITCQTDADTGEITGVKTLKLAPSWGECKALNRKTKVECEVNTSPEKKGSTISLGSAKGELGYTTRSAHEVGIKISPETTPELNGTCFPTNPTKITGGLVVGAIPVNTFVSTLELVAKATEEKQALLKLEGGEETFLKIFGNSAALEGTLKEKPSKKLEIEA